MKIGLQTWGSDGDINPFIALAGGLAAAGHQVTLAITAGERKDYTAYAERLGFRLLPPTYITEDDATVAQLAETMFAIRSPLRQVQFILEAMFEPNVAQLYATAQTLCADHDLLVGHGVMHPLQLAAEQAGKPYVTVSLNHGAVASRHISPPQTPNLGPWLNPLLWRLGWMLLDRLLLPSVNRLRQRVGQPAVRSARAVAESPLCNLIAVSPAFCPAQDDWGGNQQVCGFLRLPDAARPWAMPDSLRAFLADGEPPVYMTFGSMLSIQRDPAHIAARTRLLLDAAQAAGCRAIVQSHWHSLADIPEDPRIYRQTTAPHEHIFPHCAAVLHHGGAGTTQTALLCGRPSVIVAHIADQYFWADELRRLGVAAARLDCRSATPALIARQIRHVLDAPDMRARAQVLGRQIAAENGVAQAVALLSGIG
ncbi:MAG: nucleotide disphospho-sugar-binding domain-containing protein [Candidatus Methylumidiphilus sp.]